MAAMINYINNNYRKHIITIEDPVEFAIKSHKSLVNQREI
jgi:twitching motility protein PilT